MVFVQYFISSHAKDGVGGEGICTLVQTDNKIILGLLRGKRLGAVPCEDFCLFFPSLKQKQKLFADFAEVYHAWHTKHAGHGGVTGWLRF